MGIHNLFGPTEAAVEVSWADVSDAPESVTIGAPVWNTETLVLDDRLRPVPVGVPGELYLGGVQVARGYAAQPDLTAERFIPDPYGDPGSRLYRTGDLVRWNTDGTIEYLGRTDFQVKLRGQRVELGEIEAVLAAVPGVVHVAATVVSAETGTEHLVAYLSPSSIDVDAVKAAVAQSLPSYMVPSVWTLIDDVPLNSAGKLDRRALPSPDFASVTAEFVAPESGTEESVAQVFAELLGADRVSVTESFFDIGGNSLSAMRLAARASEVLGVAVSVRDVFEAPSVRALITATSGHGATVAPITAVVPRPQRIPLSFAQRRMWFINQFDPTRPTYNIPAVLRLSGELDVDALRIAVRDVLGRHEVLRTSFPAEDGHPYQLIGDIAEFDDRGVWRVVDSDDDLFTSVSTGFDVAREWPLRVVVREQTGGEYLLAVVAHHIGADGESLLPLVTDIVTAYAARTAGEIPWIEPLTVQFADFAIWQHDVLGDPADESSVLGRQLAYWRGKLAGVPDVLELPADRPRPLIASNRGAQVGFEIPGDIAARVEAVATERGITPFMVVHGGLATLLARLSATEDIAVATPIAGRGQRVLDPLIGMFVNTLVLRTTVATGGSFDELLNQVRSTDLDAFAHSDVPFEAIVEALDPVRSEAFSPLAQVMLSFDPAASVADADVSVAGVQISPVTVDGVPAQLDLSVAVSTADSGSAWSGLVTYATDLFDESTVAEFANRFVRVLGVLTADPSIALGDAIFIDDATRTAVLARAVGPDVAVPAGTVADALVAQAASTPDAPALWFEGRVVSYAELSARTSVLARELISIGVGPDVAVGVCIDRSIEMIVAIHAVVAAGGQYVPIATDAPADRVEFMLDTAGVEMVLVVDTFGIGGVRTIAVSCADEVDLSIAPVTDAERSAPLTPDNALYTLFTSGSTGRPKGVTVSHRAILNRLWWGLDAFPWTVGDRVIQKTPYTFDVSVPELFAPLFTGAQMIIARPGGHADPDYIVDLIEETAATSVHFVPSMLSVFVDVVDRDRLAQLTSLRWVFASGEALPAAVVTRVHDVWPNVGIHNLFGPTEAAVEVSWADVSDAPEMVTIGAPVWNTETLVLDDRLRPVPVGVPGELYLGGIQIARGYATQPGLTAERFIPDPYGVDGSRLYRTGDLVRWNADGNIEYLGRTDFQVKLRGQRVELGEIEAVLAAAPGVVHAAATVARAETGAEHLVAYLSPSTVDVDVVKSAVEQALPSYMVPSVWMLLGEVPLNSAGKLDRKALPTPDFGVVSLDYAAPLGAVEELLASIVGGLLGVDRVSVTESFFALGGDSIMSIQLASAVRAAGFDLSPREIFERRTVRGMAAAITDTSARLPELAEPEGGASGVMPVPPVVSWMIEHADTAADFADFNQSNILAAPNGLTADVLAELLGELVAHHPMLSASLTSSPAPVRGVQATSRETPQESLGGATAWELVAGNDFDAAAAVSAISSEHTVGTEGFNADLVTAHEQATRRFGTATGQLVQTVLVTDPAGTGRIVLAIHHLGVDAVSWQAIIEDLVTLWAQRSQGQPYQLRATTTSQRAWITALAERSGDHAGETGYWLERLPQRPTDFGTAPDRTRDRVSTSDTYLHQVAAEITEPLVTTVPEAYGANVSDALLGAFARAVRSWQRDRGIVDDAPVSVLIEGHGRYEDVLESGSNPARADLSRTVGWFTSIAPLSLDPGADIVHAVKAAKEERLGQPDSGIGFGWLRYGPHADSELATRPLPSVVFNYLGASAGGSGSDAEPLAFGGAAGPGLSPSPAGGMVAQGALTINANVGTVAGQRRLGASVTYPRGVFAEDDIRDLMDRWTTELGAVAASVADGADPGLSPSDVPGTDITQADLDLLATRYPGADVWPLAPLQRGLFFESELASASDAAVDVYVAQGVVTVGAIDAHRLREAASRLLTTHRALRAGFVLTASGAAVSVVPADATLPWTELDLADAADDVVAERISEIAQQQRLVPFDLTAPPLLRFVLIRHGGASTLVVTNHHLILDGWSGPLVMADLLALYATGQPFTGVQSADFGDYLDLISRRDEAVGMAAWKKVLDKVDGPTLVAAGQTGSTDVLPQEVHTFLDAELVSGVEESARANGATLATALQVAWGVLVSRLTGNRVVTFGETVSGRPAELAGVETMVGLFINTLPAVVDVDPSASIAQVLAAVQDDKVAVLDYQHLSLPDIIRGTGVSVGFDTLAVHESYPVDAQSLSAAGQQGADGSGGELGIRSAQFTDSTQYPLNLGTSPAAGGGLAVRLAYLPAAFTATQVEVFAEVFTQILRVIAAEPQTLTADIALASSGTLDTVLGFADGPALAEAPQVVGGDTIVDLLANRVSATPEATALWFGDRSVSYAELGARVSVLARELISLGIGPDAAVGLMLPRSVEMIVAVHAVLAAGGQFVPIDPAAPADRVEYITATADVSVIVTGPDAPATVAGAAIESVVAVDCSGTVDPATPLIGVADRRGRVHAETAAYTIFTSGSTGRPKGVTVSHGALLTEVIADIQYYRLDESDIFLQTLEYTFDPAVLEILRPVTTGAPLVLLAPGAHRDPRAIETAVRGRGVTTMMIVPPMLAVMVEVTADDRSWAATLRRINTGGDTLPPAVAAAVADAWPWARLYNQYGPTETTIFSTIDQYDPAVPQVTIGRPLAGIRAYVLDERLHPVPVGIPGELYLGGAQVARGYAGQAGLTAERFVADPTGEPGRRLYRTGDLAVWDADGRLTYLGRSDFQVKLRGQRLELGEVEAALAAAPGVRHSAATVSSTESGAQHLVAYLSPGSVDVDAVRASVAQTLPVFMVPTVWNVLDEVPLNSAGKIDRRALPAPDFGSLTADYVAPDTDTERLLADVFGQLLGMEQVSVTESFFDLGGNSLSAMRLAARAGEALGVEVSVRDIFGAPSIRELIAATADHAAALAPVVAVDPRPQRIPLSFAQQRMWFINQFDPTEATYNLPAVLRLTGELDTAALRVAVLDVVARHEVLRTSFPSADGKPHQSIGAIGEFDERAIWRTADSEADLFASATTGFDVSREWPLRVRLLAQGEQEHLLAVIVHHIGADGESMLPLVTDIVTAYSARVDGQAPQWEPLAVQFADFAIWQHEVLGSADDADSVVGRQLGYWTTQLAGLPDVLELPADRPRPQVASHRGDVVNTEIPAEIGDRIVAIAQRYGVTPFMVVHAGFATLLSRLSATDDIAVATPIAGRGDRVLDPLVGMFVNTLVLRTQIAPGESFADFLGRVRVTDLDAFGHADLPFESLVEALDPVRSEAFSPLAQVMLSFDPAASVADAGVSVAGLQVGALPTRTAAQLDLSFEVSSGAAGQGWPIAAIFATDLYDADTVATMVERLVRILDAVTADPTVAVGDIALTGDDTAVLAASAGETIPVPAGSIADAVAAQVVSVPDATAVVFGDRVVSFAEFGARVTTLARELIAAGVAPDVAVGVVIDRSVEMMVAIHAVVAAGGQYVPIATDAPADRVRYMLDTAGVRIVLVTDTSSHVVSRLVADAPHTSTGGNSSSVEVRRAISAGSDGSSEVRRATSAGSDGSSVEVRGTGLETSQAESVRTIVVSCDGAADLSVAPVTDADRIAPIMADTALYTLFTSGSTGRPKGVTVSHRSVRNRLAWMADWYGLSSADVYVQKTPTTFDVSVWELFLPLMAGATLVIAEPDRHGDPAYVADLVERRRVSVMHFVPSMLSAFVDMLGADRLADLVSLGVVFTSGEALTAQPARALLTAIPSARLVNLYGPTEAAVDVTAYEVRHGDTVIPIGVPVPNTTTLVLDARLRPTPVGVPGELYLGGVQVARGYAARTDLTAERFVADPFNTGGGRLYRTGDLVRWGRDGQLEYLGRTDFQVKLRGQRLELGEIEAVLASVPGVVHAAATVATTDAGAQHLVAYLSPSGVDLTQVQAAAEAALPAYMVPTVWNMLDDVPLGSSGKLDRKALPAPDFGALTGDYVAPLGAVEELLASVVGGLLGADRVSVTESFFALGGDSIMSIQLASAMRAAGFALSPRDIFEHRTVRAMAAAMTDPSAHLPELAEPDGGGAGDMVIPPIVSWMTEYADIPADFADFNQAVVLAAPRGVSVDVLAELLAVLVAQHPMLSARLTRTGGDWALTAGTEFDAASAISAMTSAHALGSSGFDDNLVAAHAAAAGRLDPATGRIIELVVLASADGVGRIVTVIHHLGTDAVSWAAIIEDLVTLWAQHSAGHPLHLRDTGTSLRAWSAALAERIGEREAETGYWLDRLPQRPTDFGAPLDRSRDRASTAVSLTHTVDPDVTEAVLTTVPEAFSSKASGGNVNDVLLGTFARAVRGWQHDHAIADHAPVSILLEGHGRNEEVLETGADPRRADLSRSVGWFTTIAPVSIDPADDVLHAVKAAKEERLGQPDSGIGFGWLRYRAATTAELAQRPLPSILFNYLGAGGRSATEPGREPSPFTGVPNPGFAASPAGAMAAQAILAINAGTDIVDGRRCLTATIAFPEAVLGADAVRELMDRWSAELAAVVDAVAAGSPGLSPSDVPGAAVTQADLDALAERFPGADVWPLSPLQGGLYFQAEMADEHALDVYLTQAVLDLGPGVDLDRLHRAVDTLVDQHRVLRSAFVRTDSGAVVAVVPTSVRVPWQIVDLGALAGEEARTRVAGIAAAQKTVPFDMAAAPLLRVIVVTHADGMSVVITNHHILFDGWSGPLVLADLLALYATGSTFTGAAPESTDFADYVMSVARKGDTGLDVWRQIVGRADGATFVAPGAEATVEAMPRKLHALLPADALERLEAVAREHNATLATALQAAWAVLLSRITGNQVVTFGETVSGRPAELTGVESMVGLFINTLPVVVDVDPARTVGGLLEALQADKVKVLDYQHIPLPKIFAAAGVAASFDTLMVHESYPINTDSLSTADAGAVGGLEIVGIEATDATHYPLNMITAPVADGLAVDLKYLPSAFSAEHVQQYSDALVQILTSFAMGDDRVLADIDLLTDTRRAQVAELERGPVAQVPAGTVADALVARSASTPELSALWFEGRSVSYGELSARTGVLARELIAAGVGPDVAVGVCIDRSVEMVVAIHAVVAAGGQYVPIA
ncbi:non-ribosomal peptide synthetase, partial [Gordonia sp. (in: high G+C Gram-positive bacteria)]|uniref:non-ribosomal peptide synthetase n=1 Tax=Gordonia sp. (in: high G+C Gram-positive bacteria) TaxID=84139 RepID=UPI00257C5AB3